MSMSENCPNVLSLHLFKLLSLSVVFIMYPIAVCILNLVWFAAIYAPGESVLFNFSPSPFLFMLFSNYMNMNIYVITRKRLLYIYSKFINASLQNTLQGVM